jgi:hypothetical protein
MRIRRHAHCEGGATTMVKTTRRVPGEDGATVMKVKATRHAPGERRVDDFELRPSKSLARPL